MSYIYEHPVIAFFVFLFIGALVLMLFNKLRTTSTGTTSTGTTSTGTTSAKLDSDDDNFWGGWSC